MQSTAVIGRSVDQSLATNYIVVVFADQWKMLCDETAGAESVSAASQFHFIYLHTFGFHTDFTLLANDYTAKASIPWFTDFLFNYSDAMQSS